MHNSEKFYYSSAPLRDQPLPLPQPPAPQKSPPNSPSKSPTKRGPDQLQNLFKNKNANDILPNSVGFHGGPQSKRRGHRLAMWSWVASMIDTLILISLSCVFLLVFAFLLSVLGRHGSAGLHITHSLGKSFLAVFLMCWWMYMVILRVLIGSSVGEWACDLRLGQPHQRLKTGYPFQVILRESLILFTGIVTLPFLSLLVGKDLAGKLSGVQLFSLK